MLSAVLKLRIGRCRILTVEQLWLEHVSVNNRKHNPLIPDDV